MGTMSLPTSFTGRERLFAAIEAEQALAVAVDHGLGVHHFRVQARAGRQQPVEHAAMAVRPIHHRGDAEFSAYKPFI